MTAGHRGAHATRVSMDVGQSSTRVRHHGDRGVRDLVLPGIRADRPVIDQLAELIHAHDGFDADFLAVGLSGHDGDPHAASRLLTAARRARSVIVAHDSITGYLGANGEAPGAVAAVGTGVVVLGVGEAGVARVDGWGFLFGDSGSAYWMGRAGIEAALRASDGRGRATCLVGDVVESFGAIERVYLEVQADPDRVARVAAFAQRVTAAAEAKDRVAQRIVDEAARELVRSLMAALDRAGTPTTARVSAVGQVAAAEPLRTRLADRLSRVCPEARLEVALGEPIDGVELLHTLASTHPLAICTLTATRCPG